MTYEVYTTIEADYDPDEYVTQLYGIYTTLDEAKTIATEILATRFPHDVLVVSIKDSGRDLFMSENGELYPVIET